MLTLGIDPSTKTGLVWTADGTNHCTLLNNPQAKGIKRVQWLKDSFEQVLDSLPDLPDVAVIEGYAYANQHTLSILVEIGVSLRLSLYSRGIPCYICPPSVLKRYATGKGNSKKPEVASAVSARWGFQNPSDDVVDAYVLDRMAQELASGAQAVTGIELLV